MSIIAGLLSGVVIDTLVPMLAKAGAPLLIDAIKSRSPMAGRVVEKIAEALGVASTPEAIVARYEADPTGTATVIQQVEAEDPEMWKAIAAASAEVNATIRAEHGAEPLLVQRLWRPVFAFVYTAVFGALGGSLVTLIWRGDVATINALVGVSGLLMGLMGMGAAVLGVYTWQRSREKMEGAAE